MLTGSNNDLQDVDNTLVRSRLDGLSVGDIRYGWLKDIDNKNDIDEVLISAPFANTRFITGHGGTFSTLAIFDNLKKLGFQEASTPDLNNSLSKLDFSSCQTDMQAAVLLEAYEKIENDIEVDWAEIAEVLRPRIVCLVGAPNVGKSSLMNVLAGGERAMVSPIEGTTRDAVEHFADIRGYYTNITDTAGFRAGAGVAESEAMQRGASKIKEADVVVLLFDSSRELSESDFLAIEELESIDPEKVIIAINKKDLDHNICIDEIITRFPQCPCHEISCKDEVGVNFLLSTIGQML